ncbi:MAG: hypothetical protein FGF48_08750 [Candidatus Brockarchaeota archaeon]|nr:hypothetical protein [Candidatus Brockarchaeota archaeon]
MQQEFKKREGISKRKRLAMLASLLVGAIVAGAYYYSVFSKQEEERINSLMEYAGFTKEEAKEFDKNFKSYAPYNQTLLDFAKFSKKYPLLTSKIYELTNSFPKTVNSLDNSEPIISSIPTGEQKVRDFVLKYPSHVLDDGINATDVELMKYYIHLPDIVDKVIEKIKSQEDRFFVLSELTPYIPEKLTKEEAHYLIDEWFPELAEACKKENVPIIFGDVDEDYVNNYDEVFKYRTDPLFGIGNFTWTPTKVVNDKVYEGSIYIRAKSLRGILPSKLYWIPINYTQFTLEVRLRAFPNETIREIELIPMSENLLESSIHIKDFKGGREYLILLNIFDKTGNLTRKIKTPYIREFENLGRQLYENGVKIGIIYGLITQSWVWDGYRELGGPYEPLLGYYATNSTRDLIITERHMDWMSGHGINFILNIWSGMDDRDEFFKEAILKSEIFKTGGIKFGILYESHWRFVSEPGTIDMSDSRNIQILKDDLSYLTENYFRHPAYLKIEGKPIFYIYMCKGMSGDVIGGLKEVYKFMKENYGIQLYMMSDHALPEVDENWGGSGGGTVYTPVKDLVPLFNAMLTGIHHTADYPQYGSFEDYLEIGFKYWYDFSMRNGLDYIPFVNPGASPKYCPWQPPEARESELGAYPRSVEYWGKRLKMGLLYSNTFGIMVGDFNNLFENGHIEPTVQEGFKYLKTMKEILIKYFGISVIT